MNILRRVDITGFWGDRELSVDLHPDVNFLIGVNGSGKTTAINMIAAALNADFQTLDRLPFKKIVIHLAEVGGARRPIIELEKTPRKHTPFAGIKYRVRDKATGAASTYSLDEIEEQLSLREYSARYYREMLARSSAGVTEHLRRLLNVSWLSIHRSEGSRGIREDRGYESTVDRKLDDLSTEFVKYFSLLAKQGLSESDKIQEMVFLSLLPSQSEQELFLQIQQLDLDVERKALVDIFREFHLDESTFSRAVRKHFDILKDAADQIAKRKSVSPSQLVAIVSAWRIHSVVQRWNKLVETQAKIYEPRDTFLETVNKLLQRKELDINEKNELVAVTQSSKRLPLTQLSSGEKQLLIILGEALLQQKAPWVYIADEPELSLHVQWQEQLITNLRRINPSEQIMFATHSPDIVSVYGDRVFDMEKVLG